MGGGKATFSGTDFQARVTAHVAVASLVRHPLNWVEIDRPDIPIAVACESGGAGDDISVTLQGTETVIEIQAKAGLRADARLLATFETIANRLPTSHPNVEVIIAVDAGTSSATVKNDLRKDLIRIRQGRTDGLKDVTTRLRGSLKDADTVLARVAIIVLDLESESSSHRENCLINLRSLVGYANAEAAWATLVAEASVLARNKGRRDVEDFKTLLGGKGIELVPRQGGRPVEHDAQLRSVVFTEAALGETSAADAEKTKWDTRIGMSKQLLDAGKVRSALSVLEGLQDKVDKKVTEPSIRARFWNNMGVAQMHTGSLAQARASLLKALDYGENDPSALANLANLHLVTKEWKQSLQFADRLISIEPESVFAWSARAVATYYLGLENTPPNGVANDPMYLTALAQIRLEEHSWQEAADLLREALKVGPRHPDRLSMLAQAVANGTSRAPPARQKAAFEDIDRITTEAIEELANTEQPVKLARAYILRGMARHSLGEINQAREDFTAAATLDDDPWLSAYHQAGMELEIGNSQVALDLLDAVEGEPPAAVIVLKAGALIELNRTAEARPLLAEALHHADGVEDEVETLIGTAAVAIDAGELDIAELGLDRVESPIEQWRVSVLRARICVKRSNNEEAQKAFVAATKAAPDLEARSGIQFEYASHLASLGNYRDAVELYERSGAGDGPDYRRELYARALLADDQLTKVATLLDTMLSGGKPRPRWALELAARIALRREDFENASSLLEELWSGYQSNVDIGIQFALSLISAKKFDEASQVVDRLIRETPECSAVHLIQLAELRHLSGGGADVLQLAYDAVRADPANADIQLAYVNLFLKRERESENLDVDVVAPGTHVTLEGPDDDKLEYLILDEADLDIRHDEVSPSEESVADLIGLKVGNSVVRRPGALSEGQYTIKEIKHRFVHAFQDIFLGFKRRFPNNTALQSFKIREEPSVADFAPMIASLSDRAELVDQILELHVERLMPLGMVSVLLGSPLREIMRSWSTGRGKQIMAEWGPIHEVEESIEAASRSRPVVISMSAVFTLELLGIRELVESQAGERLVPTSLLGEIEAELVDLQEHLDDGLKTFIKVGEAITIHSLSAADVRRAIEQISDLCKWIEDKCQIVPRPIKSVSCKNEELRNQLGASSFDVLLLARETDAIIYADDLGLRGLASSEFDRMSFSTYALLQASCAAEHITSAYRDDLIVKLVEGNYYNIPITGELLFRCLEVEGYSIRGPFLMLMERVGAKEVNLDSALRVIADLLRRLALSTFAFAQLRPVCQVGLEYLSSGHDPVLAAKGLNALASGFLRFLPDAQDEVRRAIKLFLNTKLLG